MTDLDATSAGTRTCPSCGAQNPAAASVCDRCGTALGITGVAGAADAEREDLELEEAWRAAAAEGFDADAMASPDGVVCASCGTRLPLGAAERTWLVRDTPTDRHDLAVLVVRCPTCGTANRAELDRSLLTAEEAPATDGDQPARGAGDQPESDPTEVDWRHPPPQGSTPEHPLGADRRFFEPGQPGTLAEQRDLLDEEGEDIRQYTGEPVETEEGWVIPQQQNVGPGNEAGGGEWPDPATPSAMPKGDEPEPPDDRR